LEREEVTFPRAQKRGGALKQEKRKSFRKETKLTDHAGASCERRERRGRRARGNYMRRRKEILDVGIL